MSLSRLLPLPLLAWACAAIGWLPPASAAPPARPNLVFLLIDDLGWTDLGCFGSTYYETPHIDALARQGMKFTDAYAACTVCSPTRAAILSGKYPARLHLTDWIAGHRPRNPKLRVPDWTMHLALEETTLAEVLRSAGYATALVGKWHLGDEPYSPERQGFDLNVAGGRWGAPASYFWPYRQIRDGRPAGPQVPLSTGRPGEYLTDRLTDEAVAFIEANQKRPFFLYFAHYAVHTPLEAPPELVECFRQKLAKQGGGQQRCPVYAAMIARVDRSVGRVLKTLAELKLEERTVVFFTSDNGGLVLPACRGVPVTCNAPLRAGKGSAYEGGVRVPLIIRWPGRTKPAALCQEPVISVDYYPTILQMAGLALPEGSLCDGQSLVPLLGGSGSLGREAIYWHYPHYHPGGATPYGAIRQGDYRLVEFFEDSHAELYDLRGDPSETTDLARQMPQRAQQLRQVLARWRRQVGAQMPTANPDYEATAPDRPQQWVR